MKRKLSLLVVLTVVLMMFFSFTSQVSAAGESVSIDALDTGACSPDAYVSGTVTHVNGTDAVSILFTLTNTTKGTSAGFSAGILPSGTYSFNFETPASTAQGDNMSMRIDLLDGGGSVLVFDSMTYYCDSEGPGCDTTIAIPSTAVGAKLVSDANVYWKPGEITEHVLTAGTSVRAIGLDSTGSYYQVLFVCDFLWVPADAIGPNYEAPWNGAALPTDIVE